MLQYIRLHSRCRYSRRQFSVRAGIDHRKQRRKTVHAGPVANGCRNSNHRLVHQAAEHASPAPLHSGNGLPTQLALLNRIETRQQAVDTAHTDIVDTLNVCTEVFCGLRRLLGNGNIRSSSRTDRNFSDPLLVFLFYFKICDSGSYTTSGNFSQISS